jgi:hypothetical protein
MISCSFVGYESWCLRELDMNWLDRNIKNNYIISCFNTWFQLDHFQFKCSRGFIITAIFVSIICSNWLYISSRYGFSCPDVVKQKMERKAIKNKFLFPDQSCQMDSKIHSTIILQKLKNLGVFHILEFCRAEMKYKSQPLGLKQQSYFEYKATKCCSNWTGSILDWAISLYIGWYTCWQDSSTPIFIVHKDRLYIAFIIFLVWRNYMLFPFNRPNSIISNYCE